MTIDPTQIRAEVEAILADLPPGGLTAGGSAASAGDDGDGETVEDIDTVGRRLEQAHQILVDALESVEKG